MDKEFGFMGVLQGVTVEQAGRNTEAYHGLHTIIDGGYAQSYPGTKGETADDSRHTRITTAQKLQGIAYIVHFAPTLIISADTMPNTTKVKAQCWDIEALLQRLGHF